MWLGVCVGFLCGLYRYPFTISHICERGVLAGYVDYFWAYKVSRFEWGNAFSWLDTVSTGGVQMLAAWAAGMVLEDMCAYSNLNVGAFLVDLTVWD